MRGMYHRPFYRGWHHRHWHPRGFAFWWILPLLLVLVFSGVIFKILFFLLPLFFIGWVVKSVLCRTNGDSYFEMEKSKNDDSEEKRKNDDEVVIV
jgi:hypothetical protein